MANTIIPKRSSIAARVPQATDLQVGELAVNLADALIYTKNALGTVITINAARLQTGRTIGMTGDVTWTSGAFDGSGNVTGVATLANSGVTAGSYGSSTAVPVITVDAKGRVTSVSSASISGALTFTGDVTGSGTTGANTALTLANSGVTAGTYTKVTVDAKGRVTTGTALASSDVTTALGYTPLSNATSYLPLAGGTVSGVLSLSGTNATPLEVIRTGSNANANMRFSNTASTTYLGIGAQNGELRVGTTNDIYNTGNIVLHSGNYNSYSPTLTGGGASGTWAIGISGNAGTATTLQTARSINAVSFNGSADITIPRLRAIDDRAIAPADVSSGYVTASFGSWANNSTSPYADTLIFRTYTDATGGNDNLLMLRKGALGLRVWQQAFGSATAFSSYKDVAWTDGTNATGSWGISVTGSAGSVAWGNVTGRPTTVSAFTNDSGYITQDGNARIGVENNGTLVGTRRRINFIAGSNVTLNIADDAASEEVDVTIGLNLSAAGVSSFNGRAGVVTLSSGDVTSALGYTPLSTGGGTLTGRTIVNVTGRALTVGGAPGGTPNSVVATQTSYLEIAAGAGGATNSTGLIFHNPNISTSVLEYVNTTADNAYFNFRSDDSSWNVRVNGNEVLHAGNFSNYAATAGHNHDGRYLRADISNTMFSGQTSALAFENQSSFFRFAFNDVRWYDWNNGYDIFGLDDHAWASTSMRAPIFYDRNDTTYYVDPAGNGTRAAYLNGNLWINPKSESYGEGIAFLMPSQSTWGGIRWTRSTSNFTGAWAFGYFGNEANNDIGFHNGTNGWRLDHSFNMTSVGSVRSPIFYDSGDTGYFWNPNTNAAHRLQTPSGYLDLAPMNASWCHFQTDRPRFYFGKSVSVDGDLQRYSDGAVYWHTSSAPRAGNSDLMYYAGFTLNANDMPTNSAGFTYSNNAPFTGPIIRTGTGGGYDMQINASYGNSENLAFRSRNGDAGTWNAWRRIFVENAWQNSKYFGDGGQIYGTIFYDANDSGYYCDPNGTNRLNFVNSNNHYIQPGFMLYSDHGSWQGEYNKIQWHAGHLYLQNAGGGYLLILRRGDGGERFWCDYNGNVVASGNITANSDSSLKTNVKTIKKALSIVKRLRGVTFDWIESGEHSYGVIAQEVEKVLPELVLTSTRNVADGDTSVTLKSVDYSKLTSVLIEAVKEQDKTILSQAKQLKSHEDRIARLESIIEKLVGDLK
jgi:Chaperone of endosialidase